MTNDVTFATFCHEPHLDKLHAPGVLQEMIESHKYPFQQVLVVHQRCKGVPFREISEVPNHTVLFTEDYPGIFALFGIKERNPDAERYTHGAHAAHYWKWHVLNHLVASLECLTEWIVFSDCDCLMIQNEPNSWIEKGIRVLKGDPTILIVSPNDGGDERGTQNVSQQLFLMRTRDMFSINLDLPWNGKFDAPGGPFAEYYFMLEGRIGRYLTTTGRIRYVLGPNHRYWHYNPWEPQWWVDQKGNSNDL